MWGGGGGGGGGAPLSRRTVQNSARTLTALQIILVYDM